MITFDEVRQLIILVFWLVVTYKFVDAMIAAILKRILVKIGPVTKSYETTKVGGEGGINESAKTKGLIGFRSDN